jgi:hypothetical protein
VLCYQQRECSAVQLRVEQALAIWQCFGSVSQYRKAEKDHRMRRLRANRFSVFAYLRLLAGSVGAALASLAIVEAQSWPMVVLTLGVTEWGHLVALLGLATLLPGWRRTRAGSIGWALGVIAAALSLSSLVRAAWLARRLPTQLVGSFGQAALRSAPGAPPRTTPLVAREVLLGIRSPKVRKSRIRYATSGSQRLDLDLYHAASASGCAPCVIVIHGGSWNSGDSSQIPGLTLSLAARLAAVGCPHLLLRLPWATHGCDVNFSGPSGQISTFAIERFLAAVVP